MHHNDLKSLETNTRSLQEVCGCDGGFSVAQRNKQEKMPPELPHAQHLVQSPAPFSPSIPLSEQTTQAFRRKQCRGNKNKGMNAPGRKIIPVLVLILSGFSILRLVRITVTTSSSTPTLQRTCNSPTCPEFSQLPDMPKDQPRSSANTSSRSITDKEFKLLSNLIKSKAPCNLLIFGLEPQLITLSEINAGGTTIFLEDDLEMISTVGANSRISNSSRIYKTEYLSQAKEAYELLKHARGNPDCLPRPGMLNLNQSKCGLALRDLPQEVYVTKWDVVVVDGPRGDAPGVPGRMTTIYSAAILARAGNSTDVVVHDVDRMIERWFSWEFLCDEYLLSSKGRLWIFRIRNQLNSTAFCT